jgi:hypothetical protein
MPFINHIGVDQYGHHYGNLGKYPRKELMERLCIKHVSKMYCDLKNGKVEHTGYVIGGLWITVYRVIPFKDGKEF